MPKGLLGRGMDGKGSMLIEKPQTLAVYEDVSARDEYYARAKEVLWMEDKKVCIFHCI